MTFDSEASLIDGLTAAITRLGASPTVVAVDDLAALDQSTRQLVIALAARADPRPVLVIATLAWGSGSAVAVPLMEIDALRRAGAVIVDLGGLGPSDLSLLIQRELDDPADPVLSAAISAESEGNPLLAIELVHHARSSRRIALAGGRWSIRAPNGRLGVPDRIRSVVEARTRVLPPEVRSILASASELGVGFSVDTVACAASATLDEALGALDAGIDAELIVELPDGYAFAHPLHRSVLRESVRPRARADLHLRVAQALAGGGAAFDTATVAENIRRGADPRTVAMHALRALDLGQTEAAEIAAAYGLEAGAKLATLFQTEAAMEAYGAALRVWERLSPSARQVIPAADGYLSFGILLRNAGRESKAVAAFKASSRVATDLRAEGEARRALATIPYRHGDYASALAILDEAIAALAEEPVISAALRAERGFFLGRAGKLGEALELVNRAFEAVDGASRDTPIARVLDRVGMVRASDDPSAGVPILERAVSQALEESDPTVEATARSHLASALARSGLGRSASHHLEAALEFSSLFGDRYLESIAWGSAADVRESLDDLPGAIEAREHQLDLLQSQGGNRTLEVLAYLHIAALARQLGDEAQAARARSAARILTGRQPGPTPLMA
jgi:tetratricopeptide (TPR) repeat protein